MRRCLLLLLLAACRGEDPAPETGLSAAATDSLVWGEDLARAADRAGSAVRLFLDRNAWRFDRQENAERRQLDALLRKRPGERYLSRVPDEFRTAAIAIRALPPEQQAPALLAFVSHHHEEDVALIDSVLPSLEHPEVRELARDLRRDQRRDLRVFTRRLARD